MITINDVSKRFGSISALHKINLTVKEAQTTVLIGPSGCGKSTLLRLIIGLIHTDEGTIAINGYPLVAKDLLHIRRRMGYVIQEGGLFPHLTAFKNVGLMAQYLGWLVALMMVLWYVGSRYPRAIARYLLAWAVIIIAA